MLSQATKKAMKHNARLPRTAGLRTLSELSTSLTKAGLDPSRIEQRAELIAKARGLERKRKRDEEMDIDEDEEDGEDEDGDWMDVDGEGGDDGRSPPKRRRSNTGAAVTAAGAAGKHAPRTNRQMAGMRDQAQVSKAIKLRNLGQRERNMHAKAGESDRAIKVKMVSRRDCKERVRYRFAHRDFYIAKAPVFWETESGKDSETVMVRALYLFCSFSLSVYPVIVCFLGILHTLSSRTHVHPLAFVVYSQRPNTQNSPVPWLLGSHDL